MRHTFTHACKKATAHRGRWGATAVAYSDHRDAAGRLREVTVFWKFDGERSISNSYADWSYSLYVPRVFSGVLDQDP